MLAVFKVFWNKTWPVPFVLYLTDLVIFDLPNRTYLLRFKSTNRFMDSVEETNRNKTTCSPTKRGK